jgi:septal ring factor EnvC (AmiA/AmiB activator)
MNTAQAIAEYDALVSRAIATNDTSLLAQIRTKSEQVQSALNKQIEELTFLKKDTPNIKAEREHLLEQLRRIQRDYGGVVDASDDLTTLRRIREQEGGEFSRQLYLYLAFFFGLVLLVLVLVFVMGRQKADTAAMSPSTPSMSPALT